MRSYVNTVNDARAVQKIEATGINKESETISREDRMMSAPRM
jgi:hypothetical protein